MIEEKNSQKAANAFVLLGTKYYKSKSKITITYKTSYIVDGEILDSVIRKFSYSLQDMTETSKLKMDVKIKTSDISIKYGIPKSWIRQIPYYLKLDGLNQSVQFVYYELSNSLYVKEKHRNLKLKKIIS